jgi:DNA invertase Pin-like site-specific DNA recombinase
MARNVLAMVRVSDEDQVAEGLAGLERQRRDIHAVCLREGLNVVEWFTFEGVSGPVVHLNKDFKRMMKRVESPNIAGVVVSSADRFMRSESLASLSVLTPFENASKPKLIWTSQSTYNLSKYDGQLTFLFATLNAGQEKRMILNRTQAGKMISRERGDKCPDPLPAGIEFVMTDPRGRTGFYRFTSGATRVKKAFDRVLDRNTSLKALSVELGFASWQALRKTLKNPIWTGWRVSSEMREKLDPGPDGETRSKRVPRPVPIRARIKLEGDPLISERVFDDVQALLGEVNRAHVSTRGKASPFEATGLLRCSCGRPFYGKFDRRGGKTGYYICKSGYFKAAKACGSPNLNRTEADHELIAALSRILSEPVRLKAMITAALTPSGGEDLKAERDKLRVRLDALTAKRNRLVEKASDGVLTNEEIKVPLARIRTEAEGTKNKLSAVEAQIQARPVSDLDEKVKAMVIYAKTLEFLPPVKRRKVLHAFVVTATIGVNKRVEAITLRLGEGQTCLLKL